MSEQFEDFDLNRLVFAVKNNLKIFLSIVAFCFILSLVFVVSSTEKYTAKATIYIDPAQAYSADNIDPVKQGVRFTETFLDSQSSIIKSREISFQVIKDIYPSASEQHVEELYETFTSNLDVVREGETYLVNISYTDEDPKLAANIINGYIDRYIKAQSNIKNENSKKGADWLSEKIVDVRTKSIDVNQNLLRLKTDNNIISTSQNSLINQDQLTQMNDQLGIARAETATLKARYEHSKAIIEDRNINAAVAQALENDVINNIRIDYLDRKKRYATLSRRLGGSHKVVQALKKEISEYEDLIFAEMTRVMRSQYGDYQISEAREKTLEESLQGLIGVKSQNDTVQSELINLEQQAKTYEELLTKYIQQYEALNQSQTFEFTDTRVISKAVPPTKSSNMSDILLISVFTILGLTIAFIVVIYLEVNDKTIRTSNDVFNRLKVRSLGIFPYFLQEGQNISKDFIASRTNFVFHNPINTIAINEPLSIYSETLRKVKTSIDMHTESKACKVIGVSSAQANEGKSTISMNFATYLAASGKRALYLDIDIRNPVFSYKNFQEPIMGLGDLPVDGHINYEDLIVHKASNLYMIPAISKNIDQLQSKLTTEQFHYMLHNLSKKFDYIVIDFPPLEMTADIDVTLRSIDHFVLVAHWSKTSGDYINQVLDQSPVLRSKTLGFILNQVDMKKFKLLNNQPHYYEYYNI